MKKIVMRVLPIAAVVITLATQLKAQQWENTGADAVEFFVEGEGAGFGFTNYPDNVLGLPDPNAKDEAPTVDPAQILAIGVGGEITLRFDRYVIMDGPGPDFTVFENAFYYTIGGDERTYAEPAVVSVSQDGVEFHEFPYDEVTLEGCAGVTPTNGVGNPADPSVSGGDAFDLADLDLDSVRFVRIRDITGLVKGNEDHPFWDPSLNGFDLDAVVGVNVVVSGASDVEHSFASENSHAQLVTLPGDGAAHLRLELLSPEKVVIEVYDGFGRKVDQIFNGTLPAGQNRVIVDRTGIASGHYFIRVVFGEYVQTLRMPVVR